MDVVEKYRLERQIFRNSIESFSNYIPPSESPVRTDADIFQRIRIRTPVVFFFSLQNGHFCFLLKQSMFLAREFIHQNEELAAGVLASPCLPVPPPTRDQQSGSWSSERELVTRGTFPAPTQAVAGS